MPAGYHPDMGIGTSIILIAVGAILRFAVTLSTKNVNWHIVGDILMVVGIVGLVVSLIWAATVTRRSSGQTTTVVER
jgi:sulfite exporter TauE/SafE